MEEDMSVRERLNKMKRKEFMARSLENIYPEPEKEIKNDLEDDKIVKEYTTKIDKAMLAMDNVRTQILGADSNLLSLMYDLKVAEAEFTKLLEEAQIRCVVFPELMNNRINDAKAKLRTKNKESSSNNH